MQAWGLKIIPSSRLFRDFALRVGRRLSSGRADLSRLAAAALYRGN